MVFSLHLCSIMLAEGRLAPRGSWDVAKLLVCQDRGEFFVEHNVFVLQCCLAHTKHRDIQHVCLTQCALSAFDFITIERLAGCLRCWPTFRVMRLFSNMSRQQQTTKLKDLEGT
jgi:hypothetical protein